jgi:hypothetical protein
MPTASVPAAPPISQDTLLEVGRVNRPPLLAFARAILDRLGKLGWEPESWPEVAIGMNNASLVEALRGEMRRAEQLCLLQLAWAARLVREHGLQTAGDLALQPWVNLGRLRRLEGRHAEARRHFAFLPDLQQGRAIETGPICFDAAAFRELVESRTLTPFLTTVYVVDTMKTWSGAGDFSGALAFLTEARELVGQAPMPILDELQLITLANLGRYDEAMAVTERPTWQEDGFSKLCKVTYRVSLLAAVRSVEAAAPLAADLTAKVLRAGLEKPSDQRVLRYLHVLATLSGWLGQQEGAVALLRLGLNASRHFGDVPIELSFLEALLATAELPDRELLTAEREALLRTSLYAALARSRGVKPDAAAAASPLFQQIWDRLEQIAAGPGAERRCG